VLNDGAKMLFEGGRSGFFRDLGNDKGMNVSLMCHSTPLTPSPFMQAIRKVVVL
jgi:hypothetical protein